MYSQMYRYAHSSLSLSLSHSLCLPLSIDKCIVQRDIWTYCKHARSKAAVHCFTKLQSGASPARVPGIFSIG